ncbi:MAG: hypothetical protein Ct9H300mP13_5250 [Gammaproteobacteria bacterium]|nr:MAG: hypothetical protein Ct9H300mP13_5250 [Gammaproteobacteria bacterium]
MTDIRKVGVIGAGVMGSGIAAHMANAGLPVVFSMSFPMVPTLATCFLTRQWRDCLRRILHHLCTNKTRGAS